MNTLFIEKIIGIWQGGDKKKAEIVYEVRGELTGPENRHSVHSLAPPRRCLSILMELSNRERIALPTDELVRALPDRTGVLVVFDGDRKFQAAEHVSFLPPNNAAIFNADGTLRFQLKNPAGKDGSFRTAVSLSLADGTRGLGVRACPRGWPACEDVYVIDGSTDDLSKQIPHWVRD